MEDTDNDSVDELSVEENSENEEESSGKSDNDYASDAEDVEKKNINPTDADAAERNNRNTADAGDAENNVSNPSDAGDSLKPKIGMVFGSVDEAFEFYRQYGYRTGFGVTRRTSHSIDGIRYRATFQCRKAGTPRIRKKGVKARRRPVVRSGCQAMMVIRDQHFQNQWEVHMLELKHNHPLDTDMVKLMTIIEKPESVKKRLQFSDKASIPFSKSNSTVWTQGERDLSCLFPKKDRNPVGKISMLRLGEGDNEALMKFLDDMQARNANFFFSWDMDEEGRLRNVFWADARCRLAYQYFCDVISFDTMYLTNQYNMPLTTFVGVNHHGQSVLLGCGLLADEKTETYIWLFKKWLSCMNLRPPEAIITDHCKSISGAIAEVFPHARHCFCATQIMKKLPKKLGKIEDKEAIISKFNKAAYESLTIAEFEREWGEMIEQYRFKDNAWFSSLYEDRKQWVPACVKDTFWAGIPAQRSESMNNFFDGYVTSKTTLKTFFEKYDNILRSKLEKEAQEDFRSFHTKPQLISCLQFEEQISNVYTINIFRTFQDEVKQLVQLNTNIIEKSGPEVIYLVTELAGGKKVDYKVVYNSAEEDVWCACRSFQFRGILCSHALCVLRQEFVMLIPSKYILSRWRKDFKRVHASISSPQTATMQDRSLYDDLYLRCHQYFADIVEIGAMDRDFKNFALSVLKEASDEVIRYEASHGDRGDNDDMEHARQITSNSYNQVDEILDYNRMPMAPKGRSSTKRLDIQKETDIYNVKGSNKERRVDPSKSKNMRDNNGDHTHVQQNQSHLAWTAAPMGTQENFAFGMHESQSYAVASMLPVGAQGSFSDRVGSIPMDEDNHTPYYQWPGFGNLDSSRRI